MDNHYDEAMRHAISLALLGEGKTGSNPIVGAVILDSNGQKVSEGFHSGGDHAEVVAIKAAKSIPSGSTIVVTLEPCNHTGRTGPCVDAIIETGISRVVYATADPNPIAAGGADRLREAGIEVVSGVLESASRFFNRAWFSVIEKRRPLFIWKIAATLDGKTAALDGSSKWITSEPSREFVSFLRRKCDGILVGTGTVIADNPELIPHDDEEIKNPLRIIMGNREIPANSHVLDDRAELLHVKSHDFSDLVSQLLERGIKYVFVEAGSELGTAMMRENLIDEIMLFQAPSILGAGRNFIGDLGISTLVERKNLEVLAVREIGKDIFTHLKVGI